MTVTLLLGDCLETVTAFLQFAARLALMQAGRGGDRCDIVIYLNLRKSVEDKTLFVGLSSRRPQPAHRRRRPTKRVLLSGGKMSENVGK